MKRAKLLIVLLAVIFAGIGPADAHTHSVSRLKLDAAMGHPVLLADKQQIAYLRIGLTGFDIGVMKCRTPVNVAIVIDKSGSMQGEKIARAKDAAIMAIRRLNSDDIVSVVTYDSGVNVVVPATKVSDKDAINRKIRQINAGGSTALHAGVSKGAQEMRKFLSAGRVNRMILLSDGLANVGPQSPDELGRLGAELIQDGISVTTVGLGLGYNEDLMTQLAYKSDGSHYFAEEATDLAKVFDNELGRALSVVAQEVQIEIKCAEGIRPVRLLGREGKIDGQNVSVFINHLYSKHEKYIILEVEVPAEKADTTRQIAAVKVRYDNMKTHSVDRLRRKLAVTFTNSEYLVDKRTNRDVMVDVVEQIAILKNELATTMRDRGQVEEARQMLIDNVGYLKKNAEKFESKKLKSYGHENAMSAGNLDGAGWKKERKAMRESQSSGRQQR